MSIMKRRRLFSPAVHSKTTSGFTPASLSPALWIEPAKGGIFQSNAGTTAATANSDVAGYVPDWSGNSFTLTSFADDTTRPTLQGVGSYPCLRFDGSNDALQRTAELGCYNAGSCSVFIALKSNTPASSARVFAEANNPASGSQAIYSIMASSAGATSATMFLRNDAGGVPLSGSNTPALTNGFNNTDVVVGMTDDGSTISMYLDQGAAVTQAYTRSGTLTNNRFGLGALARSSAASWWAGDIYGVVAVNGAVLSAGQRSSLVTYLAALQGRSI